MSEVPNVDDALTRIESNPSSASLYKRLITLVEEIGDFDIEVKKTSLHVVHGRAFVGIHPRKDGLLLNLVTVEPLLSERLRKTEQVSANRYHNELLITDDADIDDELQAWLKLAYLLTEG
jgi:hypothetical protein